MVAAILLFGIVLPTLVSSSGDGNIHLLEDEIAVAMRACVPPGGSLGVGKETGRQRRSAYQYDSQYGDPSPRIDGNSQQEINPYNHERRNTSDLKDQIHILNATDYDDESYGGKGDKLLNSVPRPAMSNRSRQSDTLVSRPDHDECLSQCIFANLEVVSRCLERAVGLLYVDARGIPREAELWNIVQSSVTSQQSRAALRDQLRRCFEEIQSETEDDGCSYSNKLEKCLMLQLSDRKPLNQDTNKNN